MIEQDLSSLTESELGEWVLCVSKELEKRAKQLVRAADVHHDQDRTYLEGRFDSKAKHVYFISQVLKETGNCLGTM